MNNSNTKKRVAVGAMITVFFAVPHLTFAAFSFTQVSSYNDGKAYTYPSNTAPDVSSSQADVSSPPFYVGIST